jgi:hypothetical protein
MGDAERIAQMHMGPRAQGIERLAGYVDGTQYAGRVAWWDTATHVSIFERAPCFNYSIVGSAIASHVAFCLGEGHWPELSSCTQEDDEDVDPDWGLDEDDSSALDRFINVVLVKYANLKTVARQMLSQAMGSKSCALIVSIKLGHVVAETVRASWCTPTLDAIGRCTRLEIKYPYVEDYQDPRTHEWLKRCMLYRRVIDDKADTCYKPLKARADGAPPKDSDWSVDAAKTKLHGLGFCPVHWYPYLRECEATADIDGHAIHEQQMGNVDQLNLAISQKQRAAVTVGDPTTVEIGVDEGHNPAPGPGPSRAIINPEGGPKGADGKPSGVMTSTAARMSGQRARPRGANTVWRYPAPDTKVALLILPPEAIEGLDSNARDIRGKVAEGLSAVFVDATDVHTHAAMSGKALAFVFSRQLTYCDRIRTDYEANGLVPLVSLLLRVLYVVGKADPRSIYVPGLAKVLPILAGFERDVEGGTKTWLPPRLECAWGPYFPANEQDQLFLVQLAAAAIEAGIVTLEMAVQKLLTSGVFEGTSAAAIVDMINKEKAQKQADAIKQMQATAAIAPPAPAGPPGAAPPKGPQGAKAAATLQSIQLRGKGAPPAKQANAKGAAA